MNLILKLAKADEKNLNSPQIRSKVGKVVSVIGILCNVLLAAAKLFVGLFSGAISVIGDAVNNLFDAVSSIVSLVGFKVSEKPADSNHPYGYGRFEYISAMIVAVLILFVGVELAKGAIEKIISPTPTPFSFVTTAILIFSIIVKLCLAWLYRSIGKKIDSPVLNAASVDSANDVITTFAVLVAITLEALFGWHTDGYGGLLVSLFIIFSGAKLIKETIDTLLGVAGSPKMRADIESIVCKNPKVLGVHDLLVHDYGPGNCFASVHVELDHRENALSCHDIIDCIERECLEQLNVHLVIHYDPIVCDDEDINQIQSVIENILSSYNHELTLHDFRINQSSEETRLIFDVSIPDHMIKEKDRITEYVNQKLSEYSKTMTALITFDPKSDK